MTRYVSRTLRFGEDPSDALAMRLQAATRHLLDHAPSGVLDVVPGYLTLLLAWDARYASGAPLRRWLDLAHRLAAGEEVSGDASPTRERTIRVRYDGADLADVARATGLTEAEVVARHAAPTYTVHALGFTPGFPFLAGVDEALHLPRRATPRRDVPAHAVAIAGRQTGVYPFPSPGGWHLLGSALDVMFDPHREEPFLLNVGDRVRFQPSDGPTPAVPEVRRLLPKHPRHPRFLVEKAGLLDLVLDEGRPAAGRFGLAQSGPMDGTAARHANALLANPPTAPLLEIHRVGPTLTVLDDVSVVITGGGVTPTRNAESLPLDTTLSLQAGDTLTFPPSRRGACAYLAVAGGFEAEPFLGSVSVDLRGRIGRPLEPGDVLGVRQVRRARMGFHVAPLRAMPDPTAVLHVRIQPGPQAKPDALAVLTHATYRLLQGDRTALQFEGSSVPGGEVPSEGTPLGSIQVPADGQPRVLMNDRGSLGGYAKPAIVHPGDLSRLAQARPGQTVRFHLKR